MAIIHMSFNEADPDDSFLYEKLQAIGRKNRTSLMKVLVKNAIDQYEELFEPEFVGALIAILQRGSPLNTPLSLSGQQPVKRSLPKQGKKRGRKPKIREEQSEEKNTVPVNIETVAIEETNYTSVQPITQESQQPVKKNFYQMMGDYLEDGVYNT